MKLEEKQYKLEETIDHLEEIKLIWKDNEKELSWDFIKEVDSSITQLKSDIEEIEDEIKWENYKHTEEYARAEWEDMQIDLYRGK